MMVSLKLPASSRSGYIANLKDVTSLVPENDWVRAVLEFYGAGIAPAGLHMADFEDRIQALDTGWIFSWKELCLFANDIQQVFDCFIVAVDAVEKIVKPIEVDEPPQSCFIALEAFDSHEWIIWSDVPELLSPFSVLRESNG
ncbi:hypothetical protein [Pseudomonas triticifolii]|uniref:Uncharacterized protein n=1 Tax=Pseudomonas triticifolii TaxID=2762592 RepID=A0ABR7BGF9_9PSED|nr:hypothetical protein [Pseudomonas triticifolii]MBC3955675.1 hypothetical protein [Pseudomonas triticifolii]